MSNVGIIETKHCQDCGLVRKTVLCSQRIIEFVCLFVCFQLEDDIVASPSFASTIKTFALQQERNTWLMLEFSALGFIGKK